MKLKLIRELNVPDQGRVLGPGSLIWEDRLPVVWNFGTGHFENLIGTVGPLERQADGWITTDVETWKFHKSRNWRELLFEVKEDGSSAFLSNLYSLSIYANQLDVEQATPDPNKPDETYTLIKSARVREIAVVPRGYFPVDYTDARGFEYHG